MINMLKSDSIEKLKTQVVERFLDRVKLFNSNSRLNFIA